MVNFIFFHCAKLSYLSRWEAVTGGLIAAEHVPTGGSCVRPVAGLGSPRFRPRMGSDLSEVKLRQSLNV
jgi:hypothetical protein